MARNKFGGHPQRKGPKVKQISNSKKIKSTLKESINRLLASKQVLHRELHTLTMKEKSSNNLGVCKETMSNLDHLVKLIDNQLVVDSKLLNDINVGLAHGVEYSADKLNNIINHDKVFSKPLSDMAIAYHNEPSATFNASYSKFKSIYVKVGN